jgi:hypothetical protein
MELPPFCGEVGDVTFSTGQEQPCPPSRALGEASHKASHSGDRTHLRWVDRFLHGVWLDKIDRELLDRIMSARRAEGVTNSTVNRTMEVVRAVLRRAAFD